MKTPARRTNTPQALKTRQVEDLKVRFGRVSSKQSELKSKLGQVIQQIFSSYKENGFKNDKNLKLFRTYLLLKNITAKDKDFIKTLKDHKDQISGQVDELVEGLIEVDGTGKEIYSEIQNRTKQSKKSIQDITRIFQSVVDEVSKNIEIDKSDENEDYSTTIERAKNVAEQIDVSELESNLEGDKFAKTGSIILTKNNIKTFKAQIFNGLLTAIKTYDNRNLSTSRNKTNIRPLTSMPFKVLDKIASGEKTSGLKVPVHAKQDKDKGNQDSKPISAKTRKTLLQRFSMSTLKASLNAKKAIDKNLNQVNVKIGRISVGLKISRGATGILGIPKMFSTGKASAKGVFSAIGTSFLRGGFALFNIGAFAVKTVFNIGKFVIGGVVGFAKGIAKFTMATVSFVTKAIAKPLLKGLLIALTSPAGAFAVGYISHAIVHYLSKPIKALKEKISQNGFMKELKKKLSGSGESITKTLKDVNWNTIESTLKGAGDFVRNGKFLEYMANLAQLFTKENLLGSAKWGVAGWAFKTYAPKIAWKSLKLLWKGRGLMGKAASSLFKTGIGVIGSSVGAPVLAAAAIIGGFAWIIHSANKTMSLANEAQNRRKSGENYFKQKYGRKSYTEINDKFRQGKHLSMFNFNDGSKQHLSSKGVNAKTLQVIQESIEGGLKESEMTEQMKKVIERVKRDGAQADQEFEQLQRDINSREQTLKDNQNAKIPLEMGQTKLDVVVNENGKPKKVRDLFSLGIDRDEFFKFRTMYFLIRSELIKQFSNGQIKSEEEYDNLISEILVRKDGKWTINDKFTNGDFIQFKQHDEKNFHRGRTVFWNDNFFNSKIVSADKITNNLATLGETLRYTYKDQLADSFQPIDAFVEDQTRMTEENKIEDNKVMRVFGLYCDYDVTEKFNSFNSKQSILGLSLQMLFAKRTIEKMKDVFKYNHKDQKMPDLENIDQKKMEKLRTFFDLLCRNKSYVEQFRTVMRTALGSDAIGRDGLCLILTDKPTSEYFYTLDYGTLVGDPYKKKIFTSLDEIGVPDSMPRSSRFKGRKSLSFNEKEDYPFKESWIECIDRQYTEPYEGWAGYAIENGGKIADRYEMLAKQSSQLTKKLKAVGSQKQSYNANTKCQIVKRNSIAYSLVWIEKADRGGLFSIAYATCGGIKVHEFRYSQDYVNKLFGRIASDFANFLAGYLVAFDEMADKLEVQQNTDSKVAQNAAETGTGRNSKFNRLIEAGDKLTQDLTERFGGEFGIDEGTQKIQEEMNEQLERLNERHNTLIEQENEIKESQALIDKAKPQAQSDNRGGDSVTYSEYSSKDTVDIEAEARAKQSGHQPTKTTDCDELDALLKELETP